MGLIVTITEQSGNDLTDYQVRVEVTDPAFFQECTDRKYIECYFQDGSWIPHWVEVFDPANNKAVIWVKVPQIPANGTVKVLIKVNPTRTEDLSNGEAVFEFFDDFEGTELDTSKWTVRDAATVSVADSVATIKGTSDTAFGHLACLNAFTYGKAYDIKVKVDSDVGNYIVGLEDRAMTGSYIGSGIDRAVIPEPARVGSAYENGREGLFTQASRGLAIDVWRIYTIVWLSDKVIHRLDYGADEQTIISSVPQDNMSFIFWVKGNGKTIYVDWVRVRKYTEPEPSVTVEYVSETVTYTDYFYWGMGKMLSGAIANFMQLPITMEIYSSGNLLKTLDLAEISTITDTERQLIISVLKFEDDSSDSYTTDKQIVYVTDPNGNTRKLAESTYVFIKIAELPLLLGFEIQIPYEDTQTTLP